MMRMCYETPSEVAGGAVYASGSFGVCLDAETGTVRGDGALKRRETKRRWPSRIKERQRSLVLC